MINELAMLSAAMNEAEITPERWHPRYLKIPNIKASAPCVRIVLLDGQISRVESVEAEAGGQIRKYGDNHGSFPAMNLKPLYRITDSEQKKIIEGGLKGKSTVSASQIRRFCTESYWDQKFRKKYDRCLKEKPAELQKRIQGSDFTEHLNLLIHETEKLQEAEQMHKALEEAAFQMLEQNINTVLALRILFYLGNAEKPLEKDDSGKLSVVLDCQALIDKERPVISRRFTQELNQALLSHSEKESSSAEKITDAFGDLFSSNENKEKMPKINLAGGLDVTLRTMFEKQPCQERYSKFEGDSYPISGEKRLELASALEWIGKADNRDLTWYRTGGKYKTYANEILFVYSDQLPEKDETVSFLGMCTELESDPEEEFIQRAKAFISSLSGKHDSGAESRPEQVHIFILRKIDKARTRVLYSRVTDPYELDRRSRLWDEGKDNLPALMIGKPKTLLLLDAAEVMNRAWKQDGTQIEKFRQVPIYHGMEMFFGAQDQAGSNLSMLIRATGPVAPRLVQSIIKGEKIKTAEGTDRKASSGLLIYMIRQATMLMGFLLLELGCRKESYMKEFSYLYGQLLKISDELHLLYCKVVRKKDIPQQLAGGSLYMSVPDAPIRAMGMLSERVMPYINWAKTYQNKNVQEEGLESWRAGWLMKLYCDTAGQIHEALEVYHGGRFTDIEKAQFFLGYLSAFPRRDDTKQSTVDESANDNGGNENG